ncbi:MAG TPA: hypothetical protein VJ032_14605, partial [Thermoanaerobaculia bacterium]|nr:hypothetical protein [Thermoanaerobaculia bacterium]
MKRIASTLLPFAVGSLLAAGAFELLLRQLAWSSGFDANGQPSMQVRRVEEGSGVLHRDARGVRVTPPIGGAPILAVGDSFTEAAQVNDDDAFTARLQTLLGIPVLNAGVAAQSPADYVLRAPQLKRELQPVWTVIQLNEGDLTSDAFAPSKAQFETRDGKLVAIAGPPVRVGRISRFLSHVRSYSALANYALARVDLFRSASHPPPLFRAADVE